MIKELKTKSYKLKARAGLSLIEISIVVVIISIVTVVAVSNLVGTRSKAELDNTTKRIVALLREAQSRSISQDENTVWGVRFDNSTTTKPFYALFKTSYSAANVVSRFNLPGSVQFVTSSIDEGGTLDISFVQLSGVPSTSTSISLKQTRGEGGGGAENVSRESSGKIFFDDFNRSNL